MNVDCMSCIHKNRPSWVTFKYSWSLTSYSLKCVGHIIMELATNIIYKGHPLLPPALAANITKFNNSLLVNCFQTLVRETWSFYYNKNGSVGYTIGWLYVCTVQYIVSSIIWSHCPWHMMPMTCWDARWLKQSKYLKCSVFSPVSMCYVHQKAALLREDFYRHANLLVLPFFKPEDF